MSVILPHCRTRSAQTDPHAGGAPPVAAAIRVTFWGALAIGLTAGAGAWFGATV